MIVVPALTLVTFPDVLTVATVGLLLLQVPPAADSVIVVVVPVQIAAVPEIAPADGNGFTVTVVVAIAEPQELVIMYEIVVLPADTPVTFPEASIVATPVAEELQVPPVAASESVVELPEQSVVVPVIVPAEAPEALTVILIDAATVPQLLDTV